jgi:hypothetical protein
VRGSSGGSGAAGTGAGNGCVGLDSPFLVGLTNSGRSYVQLDYVAGQRDVAYLLARVFQQLGKVELRDEAARLFRLSSELAVRAHLCYPLAVGFSESILSLQQKQQQPTAAPLLVAARAVSAEVCALPGLLQSMINSRLPKPVPA